MVISVSTAETANIRQERIGPAVDQDRAGAAHAVLAADVGAGEPEVVAQRVGQQPAGGHPDVVGDAVHGQAYVVQLSLMRLLRWSGRGLGRAGDGVAVAARTTRSVSTRTSWAR